MCQWRPPPPHVLKMNCDGSVSSDRHVVGVGVVFRNSSGGFVGAVAHRLNLRLRPGINLGLDFAVENGWSSMMVESDCMEAIHFLSGDEECLATDCVVVRR